MPHLSDAQHCPSAVLLMHWRLPQTTGIGPSFWPFQGSRFSQAGPAPLCSLLLETFLSVITNYPSWSPTWQGLHLGHLHVPESCHHTISSIIQDVVDQKKGYSLPQGVLLSGQFLEGPLLC